MTAERDALFRLLTQLADGLDDLRAEERRHVKALERARKWVEALQLLFRMFERALPPGPEATPIPSAAQIRRFLDCFEILAQFDAEQRAIRIYGAGFDPAKWPHEPDPDVVAVRMWLSALAGEEPKPERELVRLLENRG